MFGRNIFRRGTSGIKRNGRILAYILICAGIAILFIWIPVWIWFVLAGIILILVGIDIYKE